DDGHFTPDTLTFLEQDLITNQGKKTLIFIHHLVNPIPSVTDNPYVNASYLLVDNYQAFKTLIEGYPDVWIVFSGHAHFNSVTYDKGILYVVSASVIHYPVQYNILHIYENAVIQEARKISGTISLSEWSRAKMIDWINTHYGFLGEDIAGDALGIDYGKLRDRAFVFIQGEYQYKTVKTSDNIKVYPNPVKPGIHGSILNFEIQFERVRIIPQINMKIFDISGHEVYSGKPNYKISSLNPFSINIQIDVKGNLSLASGIYLYIIEIPFPGNPLNYSGKFAVIK
ncbi:MAG: hypothetical protein PHV06_11460, partial [bacterium]|nr:hypothetical protein [bacterium]